MGETLHWRDNLCDKQINWQIKWQTSHLLACLIVQYNHPIYTISSPHLSQKVNVYTLYVLYITCMPGARVVCIRTWTVHTSTRVCTHGRVNAYTIHMYHYVLYVHKYMYTYPREIYITHPFNKKEVPVVKVLQFEYVSILPETKWVY